MFNILLTFTSRQAFSVRIGGFDFLGIRPPS